MEEIVYHPIGYIRTPYGKIEGMPITPIGAESVRGQVVVDPQYAEGLNDIDGLSHLILLT